LYATLKNWPIYTVIGRPGGHRSCFVAMAPRCKAPSFVINGVRCQPRRSKKATWEDLIYVGNAGWRCSDAVAPSLIVRVRVGQSRLDAVQQHPKLVATIARVRAEAGAGAAGCKMSVSAGGVAGAAGRVAGGADDAMDCLEGDEAGGEADGKAAADLGGADRCGAGTATVAARRMARPVALGVASWAKLAVRLAVRMTAWTLTAMRRAAR